MAYPYSSVEASSLSDITQLASHPPKYPRNPTEQRRDPLTLYIVRVPGSRDIILTPLKPQLKNVAAQDVSSSLYYLHLNTEDDARLLEDDPAAIYEEPEHQSNANASLQKPLPRKPLPESARASLDISTDVASGQMNSPSRPSDIQIESSSVTHPFQDSMQANKPIQRRPLGPRTLPPTPSVERKPVSMVEHSPIKASHGVVPNLRVSNDIPRSTAPQHHNFGNPNSAQYSADSFSVTLIRREPGSGAQWNVGTITGRPVRSQSPDRQPRSPKRSKKPYFDISVTITSPGYTPFRYSQPVGHQLREFPTAGQQLSMGNAAGRDPSKSQPQDSSATDLNFHRQVYMEGSNPWGRPSMQHGGAYSEGSGIRGRSYSGSSAAGQDDEMITGMPQPKGYVFLSPWGGRCKFSTGGGGRTLRCKHSLPNPPSTTNPTSSSVLQQPSTIASELRFNLPSSHLFGSSERSHEQGADFKAATITKLKHIKKKLSSEIREHRIQRSGIYSDDAEDPPALPPRPNLRPVESSSDEADVAHHEDDSRLDLSLGQEKAGGGNRGKRAKLGKIIICDEGFKMLDLIVAANMGIWWSVWDPDH